MSAMASPITGVSIVYPTISSGIDQRKHQSSASLAFVRGIHRWPMNSPHKGPVTRKMFPFDDFIMVCSGAEAMITLKTKSCHNAHFAVTGDSTGCHNNTLWYHRWWQSCPYNNSHISAADVDLVSVSPRKSVESKNINTVPVGFAHNLNDCFFGFGTIIWFLCQCSISPYWGGARYYL